MQPERYQTPTCSRARAISIALLVALSAACGGRSELYDDDGDASLCPAPAIENACSSAVSGATPTRGYCSTRAMLAPHPAPTAPTMGWMVQLPSDRGPPEIVVDDCGRTYVTFDPNLGASQTTPYVLATFDEHGELTMQHDFSPDPIGNLFIARDGTLHATLGYRTRTLIRIDRDGEVTALGSLPENARRYAVASDGTLLVTISDLRSPDHVARVALDGTVLWTSPPLDDGTCGGCLSEVALFPDDRAVVAEITVERGTTVRSLDTEGALAWERHVDGILTQGPAIALDSTIRLVTGLTDSAGVPTTLVTALTSTGDVLWQTPIDEDYQQTWGAPLVIAQDGATVVRSFGALTAIEPSGTIRWQIDGPMNLTYDAVVDPRGTLVLLVAGIVGLDIATGEERWHVDGPGFVGGSYYFLSNVALGANGCLVGANYGGVVFAACDLGETE